MHQRYESITEPQKEALQVICDFIDENNYPPSIKEIGETLGITIQSVHQRLERLYRKGYLLRDGCKGRTIQVLKRVDGKEVPPIQVPILGTVAAGYPVDAPENRLGYAEVDASIAKRWKDCFCLRASGESMIKAGIDDGDLLIVRPQVLAEDGEIVVALLDGEATVKRLFHKEGKTVLLPENDDFEPIPVEPHSDLRIIGKVVGWQ